MRATLGVWGAQALMRRIPPFLFICVLREPWERVKICLLPKVETMDYDPLQKDGPPLSRPISFCRISFLLHWTHSGLTPYVHVIFAFPPFTQRRSSETNFEGSVWARNMPMGRTRAHKRLEMVSPYDSTLFSILCFSGHPLSYRS